MVKTHTDSRSIRTYLDQTGPTYLSITETQVLQYIVANFSEITTPLNILLRPGIFGAIEDNFVLETHLAAITESAPINIAVHPDLPSTHITTESSTAIIVPHSSTVTVLPTPRAAHQDLHSKTVTNWENRTDKSLNGYSPESLVNSLEDISSPTANAFNAAITEAKTSLETADTLPTFDPIEVALLAGASDKQLFKDIYTWGETNNLAGQSTFTRRRTELEEAGILTTRKAPSRGRPILRLELNPQELAGASDTLRTSSAPLVALHEHYQGTTHHPAL